MRRKVAIAIWALFAFILAIVVINELLSDARPSGRRRPTARANLALRKQGPPNLARRPA